MTLLKEPKASKPTIEEVARQELKGNILKNFEEFLEFLKGEKFSFPWASINKFKINYKGNKVGAIALGGSNIVWITVDIAKTNDFDNYLEGQNGEVVNLFMEKMYKKCVQCRPTCECSLGPGFTFTVFGKKYENVCGEAPYYYNFFETGDNMRTMDCAILSNDAPKHSVPIETVKKLILARKKYIEMMKAAGK